MIRVRRVRSVADAGRLLWWVGSRAVGIGHRVLNKRKTARWVLRTRVQPPVVRGWHGAASNGAPPTFSLRSCNPIHWRLDASPKVAALGPLELLPLDLHADVVAQRQDPLALRRYRRVLDVQAYHADAPSRAMRLVRLAAAGVVVHATDDCAELHGLLAPELRHALTTPPTTCSAEKRELHSIRLRRAAMRSHSSWARNAGNLPFVSIVMATKRPSILHHALASVAKQSYPRTELVLALHGHKGSLRAAERSAARLPLPVKVLHVPRSASLGAALQAASAAADGTLLTKMDDDDLYGPDHLWDLVLAHRYSQAEMVGKGPQFVYLAASDQTVHCRSGRGEAWRAWQCGATLLIGRRELQEVGGWRDLTQEEDVALEEDVLRAGGTLYRTHGADFLVVRHGRHHTWKAADRRFLLDARKIADGWAPEMADLGHAPRPAVCGAAEPLRDQPLRDPPRARVLVSASAIGMHSSSPNWGGGGGGGGWGRIRL